VAAVSPAERAVHPLVSSVLLGVPRLDSLVPNAKLRVDCPV